MTESELQRKCIKLAADHGVMARKNETPGHTGWPDLVLIFPGGLVIYVEVKIPGGRLRPKQKSTLSKLKELGVHVYVIDNIEQFRAVILGHGAGAARDH
jgi:hypothetical protein